MQKKTKDRMRKEIEEIAEKLGITDEDKREAMKLFQKVAKSSKLKAEFNKKTVLYAIIYIACRQNERPIGLTEIQKIAEVRIRKIRNMVCEIVKELEIRLLPINLEYLISRYCHLLNLSNKSIEEATLIIDEAKEKEIIEGKNARRPNVMVAAAIYIAAILSGEHTNQKNIAKIAGVSDLTVRIRYKEIAGGLGIDLFI